ncbi:MAG: hypothetical protein DRJ30_04125 [Candidatus Methanomethylicota archaeon]|nr:MAG: hypothetical protein DRJ30_04125 [Candidatus Verstraetearchaeota archaeon]
MQLEAADSSDSSNLLMILEEKRDNFKHYLKISGIGEIARRYFIMNAFDGAVTMLGILIGAYVGGAVSPKIILSAGLGAGIAMGVSGFFGAYLAEEAERSRRIRSLEKALHIDLDDTLIGRAATFAAVMAALIDALSPMLAALISISPFILSFMGILDPWLSYMISIGLILTLLLILGIFLGKVSGENTLYYALATTSAGLVTGLIGIFLQVLFS